MNEDPGAPLFVMNSTGADIHRSVYPQSGEMVIEKNTPDGFFETALKSELDKKEVDHLVVCGMMTHMCVDTTVRAARSLGYAITLIEDACATTDLEWGSVHIPASMVQAVFMASLSNSFAEIITADEWMARAGQPMENAGQE